MPNIAAGVFFAVLRPRRISERINPERGWTHELRCTRCTRMGCTPGAPERALAPLIISIERRAVGESGTLACASGADKRDMSTLALPADMSNTDGWR